MAEPGPSQAQIRIAIGAALRAPDHGGLRPWRVVEIPADRRPALGDVFAGFARASGKPEAEVDVERQRAFNGPLLVAWVVKIIDTAPEVPAHEQWMCAGGALSNFLTALHAMGFAAKTLSGRKCGHQSVRTAFCGPDEHLAAFVCAGTPTRPLAPRVSDTPEAAVSTWTGG